MKPILASLLALALLGCSSSRSMIDPDTKLATYRQVAVLHSEVASFVEMELAESFRALGYKIIGEREAEELPTGECFLVRYTFAIRGTTYFATVSLMDANTDKTIATFRGTGNGPIFDFPNRDMANRALFDEIKRAMGSRVP